VESVKLGCNRSIPADVLSKIKWAEPVVVADWQSQETELYGNHRRYVKPKDILARMDETKHCEVYAPKGCLIPFGYFTVDAVVPHGFTDDARERFNKTLDIVQFIDDTPTRVVRACGSYLMSGGCVVRDTIEQIVDKAENIAKLHSQKLKWFVSGRFHEINTTPVEGVKYGRGFYKLSLTIPKEIDGTIQTVRFLGEYSKRKYTSEKLDDVM